MGAWMTRMYTVFFHFPVFTYDLDASHVILAFLVSGAAGAIGTLNARHTRKVATSKTIDPSITAGPSRMPPWRSIRRRRVR